MAAEWLARDKTEIGELEQPELPGTYSNIFNQKRRCNDFDELRAHLFTEAPSGVHSPKDLDRILHARLDPSAFLLPGVSDIISQFLRAQRWGISWMFKYEEIPAVLIDAFDIIAGTIDRIQLDKARIHQKRLGKSADASKIRNSGRVPAKDQGLRGGTSQ